MNINNSNKFLQHKLFSNSLDKMSDQYRNRYAATNEARVNSQGMTGMLFNFDSTDSSIHRKIIEISDEGKQSIFDMVKTEFLKENGVHNGDTTRRTEVYANYLRGIPEQERAKASWTLDRLEAEYWSGFATAAKQTNPTWEPGKAFNRNVLQELTRQDVSGVIDKQSSKGLDLRV